MRFFISSFYTNNFEESKRNQISDDILFMANFKQLKDMLQTFDQLWVDYEQKYVYELMVIENDARRFIIESINCEAVLGQQHM